jgi:hypothetical protein
MRTSCLHYLTVAVAGATAALATACGSPQAQVSSPTIPPSTAPSARSAAPSPGSLTPSPSPAPTLGLLPAAAQLTDRLELTLARVPAGTAIKAALVVINHGHTAINLNNRVPNGLGCRPKYAVLLTDHKIPPDVGFPADCAAEPLLIEPGVNRFPVTVQTTYLECAPTPDRTGLHPCVHGSQMPTLPAAHYEAVLIGDGGLRLPAPAPVPVTLVAATAG